MLEVVIQVLHVFPLVYVLLRIFRGHFHQSENSLSTVLEEVQNDFFSLSVEDAISLIESELIAICIVIGKDLDIFLQGGLVLLQGMVTDTINELPDLLLVVLDAEGGIDRGR